MITLEQVLSLPSYHRATIPSEYQDEMGHMNVQWYVHLFSQAGKRLFESVGLSAAYFREHDAGTFALRQYIAYISEVLVGNVVSVHSRVVARSEKRLHVIHYMVNQSSETLASLMEVLATHVDIGRRRSSPFPPEISARIDGLLAGCEELDWKPALCGAIGV